MPKKKYKSENDNDTDTRLVEPLVIVASRESIPIRNYFKLLLDLSPPILIALADECRRQKSELFGLTIEYIPHVPIKLRQNLWEMIITRFLSERPWEQGLKWRVPKAVNLKDGDSGFKQVNVMLEKALADKAEAAWISANVSKAVFVFTAFVWFAKYVCPPENLK